MSIRSAAYSSTAALNPFNFSPKFLDKLRNHYAILDDAKYCRKVQPCHYGAMTSQMTDNKQTEGFAMHKTFERRLKKYGVLGARAASPSSWGVCEGPHSFLEVGIITAHELHV